MSDKLTADAIQGEGPVSAINVTPLVDVMLCLLIIFMVSTPMMSPKQALKIDVPKAKASGKRGGIHNSLTRVLVKPTHLIGGYAQLSFAFNYLGPTGNQRDEVTVVRRRDQEVEF